jgi:CRISPR-associated protein Csm3
MDKWQQVVKLTFEIRLVEGTRVGGSGGGLGIGEIVEPNLMAIRNPANNEFYIPGSSLKGKIRSGLEREQGKHDNGKPCTCGSKDCLVCTIFGAHPKRDGTPECGPTRIVVRDAPLSAASRQSLGEREQQAKPTTEEKTEATIDRELGKAENPRTGERVLPGTTFEGEILLHIYEGDPARKMTDFVRHGLGIIQEASSIGASGSRGYGKVRFENLKEETLKVSDLKV